MTKAPVQDIFELSGKRVFVGGHQGMVGSALVRRLSREGCEVVIAPRAELDLCNPVATKTFLARTRPDVVILAAAKVGGILANSTQPVEFLYDNLRIASSVIGAAAECGVSKLLYLGSSCIYPKLAPQPIHEDALLTGPLEPTNEWYAVAKIAGLKLCQAFRAQYGHDFISAMPTNLYGPGDKYDLNASHVLPALIRKAHEAKVGGAQSITIWGTGKPRREFLHVDDCADGLVCILKRYSAPEPINVGSGTDLTIYNLAEIVCKAIGFQGAIVRDESKPDGTPRKLMDASKLRALGWRPTIELKEGVASAYQSFLETLPSDDRALRQAAGAF